MKKAAILSINLNAKDTYGLTGFHLACKQGHANVVKVFMQKAAILGIDLEAKEATYGYTGFLWACTGGHSDVVKIFMKNAAIIDLNYKDIKGRTAFHWVCAWGNCKLANIFYNMSTKSRFIYNLLYKMDQGHMVGHTSLL